MATKVKGEAIKEGSIPMSALSTEVKDKIENAGGGADWDAKEGEEGFIEHRTHFIDDSNFYEEVVSEENGWVIETNGYESIGYTDKWEMYEPIIIIEYDKDIDENRELPHKTQNIVKLTNEYQEITSDNALDWSLYAKYDDDYRLYVKIEGYDVENYGTTINGVRFKINEFCYLGVRQLNDIYIPNSIARQESVDELREETTALWENIEKFCFGHA